MALQKQDIAFLRHEHDLLMYLMDKKYINKESCYMVVSFSGNKFFENKIELENYLISLAPSNFMYNFLSELAYYLIENEIIVDVTMTKK